MRKWMESRGLGPCRSQDVLIIIYSFTQQAFAESPQVSDPVLVLGYSRSHEFTM